MLNDRLLSFVTECLHLSSISNHAMVGICKNNRTAKVSALGIVRGVHAAGLMAIALATPTVSNAQATATSDAEILPALVLNKTQDLDFGSIIAPSNGRVDVFPNETCTANNDIVLVGSDCQPAKFEGSGATGQTITLTMPVDRRFEIPGPGRTMRIRAVRPGAAAGMQFQGRTNNIYNYLITDPAGDFSFNVAARALMRNNQETGIWTGSFTISVDYS